MTPPPILGMARTPRASQESAARRTVAHMTRTTTGRLMPARPTEPQMWILTMTATWIIAMRAHGRNASRTAARAPPTATAWATLQARGHVPTPRKHRGFIAPEQGAARFRTVHSAARCRAMPTPTPRPGNT
ncbi:hypothetical protein E2P64_00215 [Candidatus Bathyarchaeota archaeon]|nr:hypothetical protein E2P64_00215 [Candidatus Bathyarchaeota archaeon]